MSGIRRFLPLLLPALLLWAPSAQADSRVTARIEGASVVKRGQDAGYQVTVRNAGSQTLGSGSPRVRVDLDAIPSGSAQFGFAQHVGGAGAWTCSTDACTLASGAQLAPKASAVFLFPAKVLGSVTLDLDVTGNNVEFSSLRKSVRTSGVLLPVVYGQTTPGPLVPRIAFSLSEPAPVHVRLERITSKYLLRRKVRIRGDKRRIQRSTRCADRRPKVRRTTRVRKLRARCGLGLRTLLIHTGTRGPNLVDLTQQFGFLRPGRRYRLRLIPRTRDGRQGREVYSRVFTR